MPNHTFVNKSINANATPVGMSKYHHIEPTRSSCINVNAMTARGRSHKRLPGQLKIGCVFFVIALLFGVVVYSRTRFIAKFPRFNKVNKLLVR